MIKLSIELSPRTEPVMLAEVLPQVFAQYLPETSQRIPGDEGEVCVPRFLLRTDADLVPSLG